MSKRLVRLYATFPVVINERLAEDEDNKVDRKIHQDAYRAIATGHRGLKLRTRVDPVYEIEIERYELCEDDGCATRDGKQVWSVEIAAEEALEPATLKEFRNLVVRAYADAAVGTGATVRFEDVMVTSTHEVTETAVIVL